MSKFHGVWPALITPFTEDNKVNLAVLNDLVDYMIGKQVDGFYVGGTTGEGLYMSVEEREIVAETVLRRVDGRVPVIVHIGATALVDAIHMARHAESQGAAGISSLLMPQYVNTDDIFVYFKAITAAVNNLPLLPYIYGRSVDAIILMRELMQITNVIGAKYTGPNMYELHHVIGLGKDDDWSIFSGMDEQTVFAAMMGTKGNIGSTLNVMAGLYREIHRQVNAGNPQDALVLQMRANCVTDLLIGAGFAGALRLAMAMLGFDCGNPRLPNRPLTPEQSDLLKRDLAESELLVLSAL
ncbi:MAG: dihydrodipicolinate synthase family protein [Burkholderiales bacterium]|nr:dihydrodipicolinate synthase family protein [Anaerolineae bacterium]